MDPLAIPQALTGLTPTTGPVHDDSTAMPVGDTLLDRLTAASTLPIGEVLPVASDPATAAARTDAVPPPDLGPPDVSVALPPEGPQALQQMAAQLATHVDLAAQRHGALPGDTATPPVPLAMPAADGLSQPMPLDAVVLPVVVASLHPSSTWLRTAPEPPAPARPRTALDDLPGLPPRDDPPPPRVAARGPAPPPLAPEGDEARLYRDVLGALERGGTDAGVREALDELKRQRRIVVATPSGGRDGLRDAAAVHVLCPRPGGGRAVRLGGELLWARREAGNRWYDVHLVKTRADGGVRCLAPLEPDPGARRVGVCLGAQAVPMTGWSDACLRVRDSTRLWQALEPQWSLRLVVGTVSLDTAAGAAR